MHNSNILTDATLQQGNQKPVLSFAAKTAGKGKPITKRPNPKRYTLSEAISEAFTFEQESARDTLDLEKALRSVKYLLEWHSQCGSEPVPGFLAQGLCHVIGKCADDVRGLFTHDDISMAGAHPAEVIARKRVAMGETRP